MSSAQAPQLQQTDLTAAPTGPPAKRPKLDVPNAAALGGGAAVAVAAGTAAPVVTAQPMVPASGALAQATLPAQPLTSALTTTITAGQPPASALGTTAATVAATPVQPLATALSATTTMAQVPLQPVAAGTLLTTAPTSLAGVTPGLVGTAPTSLAGVAPVLAGTAPIATSTAAYAFKTYPGVAPAVGSQPLLLATAGVPANGLATNGIGQPLVTGISAGMQQKPFTPAATSLNAAWNPGAQLGQPQLLAGAGAAAGVGMPKQPGAAPLTGQKPGTVPQQAVNPYAHNLTRTSPTTVVWLHDNFEAADGVSLGRKTLYSHYETHCTLEKQDPVNQASFGKLIRSVFPNLKTRRLGTRGNSKYHYYGIRVKEESGLVFEADQVGGPQQRVRKPGPDDKKIKGEELESPRPGANFVSSEYIDATVTLPDFPSMKDFPALQDQDDFSKPYHAHNKRILETVQKGNQADFEKIPDMLCQFWGVIAAHFRTTLLSEHGIKYVDDCDEIFFQALHSALVTNVLCAMPENLVKELRHFAKHMEPWLKTAMEGYGPLLECKLARVRSFAHILRRYTSLNHLAQHAKEVLNDASQTTKMLKDLKKIDFHAIKAQAQLVCRDCPSEVITEIKADFETALEQKYNLQKWAEWLQKIFKQWLQKAVTPGMTEESTKAAIQPAARKFLTRWCYFSSIVIRDLTLRSAESFGSFHLMRLLYDEYIVYLVEQISEKGVGVLDYTPAGCEAYMQRRERQLAHAKQHGYVKQEPPKPYGQAKPYQPMIAQPKMSYTAPPVSYPGTATATQPFQPATQPFQPATQPFQPQAAAFTAAPATSVGAYKPPVPAVPVGAYAPPVQPFQPQKAAGSSMPPHLVGATATTPYTPPTAATTPIYTAPATTAAATYTPVTGAGAATTLPSTYTPITSTYVPPVAGSTYVPVTSTSTYVPPVSTTLTAVGAAKPYVPPVSTSTFVPAVSTTSLAPVVAGAAYVPPTSTSTYVPPSATTPYVPPTSTYIPPTSAAVVATPYVPVVATMATKYVAPATIATAASVAPATLTSALKTGPSVYGGAPVSSTYNPNAAKMRKTLDSLTLPSKTPLAGGSSTKATPGSTKPPTLS